MPYGSGTYGSKIGRPPTAKKEDPKTIAKNKAHKALRAINARDKANSTLDNAPRSIAEAKRQGKATYRDKNGGEKAAVTAEDLKKSGHKTLRAYLNAKGKPAKPAKTSQGSSGKTAPMAKKPVAKNIDSRTKAQRIKDSKPKNIPRSKAQSQKDEANKKFGFAMPGSKSRININLNKKKK